MNQNKSNPPNHSLGRQPLETIDSLHPSSLPPELGSLDMSWDDDPRSVGAIDLLQHTDLEPDVDAGERTTAIPAIPMEQLVSATMAEADARELSTNDGAEGGAVGSNWHEAMPTAIANEKPLPVEFREPPGSMSTQPAPARTAATNRELETDPAILLRGGAIRSLDDSDQPPPASYGVQSRLSATEPPLTTRSMAGPVGPSSSRPPASRDPRMSAPPTIRRGEVDSMRHQMKDRYATGDFSGALQLAESLLEVDSCDLEAQRFATSCREVLTQMLTSRIGAFEQTVEVALTQEELRWLNLDHRAGFFLSLVDGSSTIEELLDISGMARLESLRILATLLDQRVLRVMPH